MILLFSLIKPNGKEKPSSSFLKETAHEFRKVLIKYHPEALKYFRVFEADRSYRKWQRDLLAIETFSKWVLEQKSNYIHNNPLQERWNLTKDPVDYRWSFATFYKKGVDEFNMLTDYRDMF